MTTGPVRQGRQGRSHNVEQQHDRPESEVQHLSCMGYASLHYATQHASLSKVPLVTTVSNDYIDSLCSTRVTTCTFGDLAWPVSFSGYWELNPDLQHGRLIIYH